MQRLCPCEFRSHNTEGKANFLEATLGPKRRKLSPYYCIELHISNISISWKPTNPTHHALPPKKFKNPGWRGGWGGGGARAGRGGTEGVGAGGGGGSQGVAMRGGGGAGVGGAAGDGGEGGAESAAARCGGGGRN